jgi:hypothetical protein
MTKNVHLKAVICGACLCCFAGTLLGQTNQVLSLNGTSAYVSIPSSSSLQPSNAITVEAWMFPVPSGANNPFFVGKSDGQNSTSQRTYEMTWPGGILYFNLFVGTATYGVVTAPIPSNQWTHIAATYASSTGTLSLYTNGTFAQATTVDASGRISLVGQTIRQTAQPLCFGVCPTVEELGEGDTFAAGYLDEIRIWNTNLSGIQIAENRFCKLTGAEANLTAYWNFDGTNVIDLTGNGNNGTRMGGAAIQPIAGQDTVHQGICGAPYFDPASLSFSEATGFHQKLYGPSGMTLEIETSTNLKTWMPLFTLPNFSGELEFDDPEAVGLPQRFYTIVPQ